MLLATSDKLYGGYELPFINSLVRSFMRVRNMSQKKLWKGFIEIYGWSG